MDSPTAFVIHQANRADLLVTGLNGDALLVDKNRSAHVADLIMHAGRPVIVVPEQVKSLEAKNILIAWKDTREARRAIADALPFLQTAAHVVLAGVGPVYTIRVARAGSCLAARQGRAKECTSVHD